MARSEQVVLGVICVACLAAPIGLLFAGLLDIEEQAPNGGAITYVKKHVGDMKVKRIKSPNKLPVSTTANGKRPVEHSANDIPVEDVEGGVHHDANQIPVESRRTRGLRPQPPPGE